MNEDPTQVLSRRNDDVVSVKQPADEATAKVIDKGAFPIPVEEALAPGSEQPVEEARREEAALLRRTRIIEAIIFAANSPVPDKQLCEIAECSPADLTAAVAELNQEYAAQERAFRIHRLAQGWQFYTVAEYADWVQKLFKAHRTARLSRAGLEVLSIIAYRQPVTKPEIEQLRGVDSTGPLDTLLARRLVVPAGRAHKPGNPFLYRTSKEFLRYFGLARLDDLPRPEELEAFLRRRDEETAPLSS